MALPVLSLLIGLILPPNEDWVVIASQNEAVLAVERTTIRRSGDHVSATVLMGFFRPETPPGTTAAMQYYLSDETMDCSAQTRAEHEVRIYAPDGALLGESPSNPNVSIRTGSMVHDVYEALCAGEPEPVSDGHATPMEAIRAEAGERRSTGRAVND